METKEKKDKIETIEISFIIKDFKDLGEKLELIPNYSEVENSFKYPVLKTIPKNFYDKLKELVPKFDQEDVITFNPLVNATMQLQEIKTYIESEDFEESERTYIDNNKIIGSFNTSIKSAKSILKEPQISKNKMIDSIFDLFIKESENTRDALNKNFKKTLDKKEEIKQAKIAKQQKEANDKIAELSEQNSKANDIIMQQNRETRYLAIKSDITSIVSVVISTLNSLNKAGLESKKEELLKTVKFENYFKADDETLLGQEKRTELNSLYVNTHMNALEMIVNKLESLETSEKLAQANNENAVIKASMPNFQNNDDNDDLPFIQAIEVTAETVSAVTDEHRFKMILDKTNLISDEYKLKIKLIEEINFDDPGLNSFKETLLKQELQMIAWIDKLTVYVNNKHAKYVEFINQSK